MWLHQLQSAARSATPSPAQSGIGYPRAQIWSRGALEAFDGQYRGRSFPFSQVPIHLFLLFAVGFSCVCRFALFDAPTATCIALAYRSWLGSIYLCGMFGHPMAMRLQPKASDGVPLLLQSTSESIEKRYLHFSIASLSPFVISFVCLSRHYIPFCEQRCLDLLGDALVGIRRHGSIW